jgi:hypothetical protein
MVESRRTQLKDMVEVDETEMPFRRKVDTLGVNDDPDLPVGKILIVCAVELSDDGKPKRIRLEKIPGEGLTALWSRSCAACCKTSACRRVPNVNGCRGYVGLLRPRRRISTSMTRVGLLRMRNVSKACGHQTR